MPSNKQVKLTWESGLSVSGKSARVPSRPGVYAYGTVSHSVGLVAQIEWVYIGKASDLRKRISSHNVRDESNPDLQQWLRNPPTNAELWFAEVKHVNLDAVEKQLIGDINPCFNRNHRTDKSQS